MCAKYGPLFGIYKAITSFTHTLCYQLGYSYTWFSSIAQEDGPKHSTFNIIFYDATIWKINLGITHQRTFKKIKIIFLLVEFIISMESQCLEWDHRKTPNQNDKKVLKKW